LQGFEKGLHVLGRNIGNRITADAQARGDGILNVHALTPVTVWILGARTVKTPSCSILTIFVEKSSMEALAQVDEYAL
jgi:hypothetical protein